MLKGFKENDFTIKFTKDPITFSKLDWTKVNQPYISNSTKFQQAKRAPHPYLD